METTETRKQPRVEYIISGLDDSPNTPPTIEIVDPLAMVIATWNYTEGDLYALKRTLIETFQYKEDEIIPLHVPKSIYDFILIKKSITEKRPFGVTWSDRDGGTNGHEIELIGEVEKFCLNLNASRNINVETADISSEGYVTYSVIYGNESIPDSTDCNILGWKAADTDVTGDDGNWCIPIVLTEDNLEIIFHMVPEASVPYHQ